MRKSQREIKDFGEIVGLLGKCDTLRLGINGDDFPYVVPLSFGYEAVNGKLFIYFHCAKEGKKVNLLKADNRVCAEADILNSYAETGSGVTADYASVIAFGRADEVFGEEAVKGIELLLEHCKIKGYSARECVKMGITAVYRISVESITGKKRF